MCAVRSASSSASLAWASPSHCTSLRSRWFKALSAIGLLSATSSVAAVCAAQLPRDGVDHCPTPAVAAFIELDRGQRSAVRAAYSRDDILCRQLVVALPRFIDDDVRPGAVL